MSRKNQILAFRVSVAVLIHIFFKIASAPTMAEMIRIDHTDWVYFTFTVLVTLVAFEITDRTYKWLLNRNPDEFLSFPVLAQFVGLNFLFGMLFIAPANYLLEFHIEDLAGCTDSLDEMAEFVQNTFFSGFFILAVTGGYIVYHFNNQKKKMELISEQLKKENAIFQYESLKNQLNPHFLFNSFSVLTSLVHKDADTASDFVSQLSKIYRYVLENKEKNLIDVEKELEFLESYMFLLKIRHDESLEVEYDVKVPTGKYQIPTLALQMLAENAAKHNSFSAKSPLKLKVYSEGEEYLIIRNSINQRKVPASESTGLGLKNINQRYKLSDQKEMQVTNDGKEFIVKLPLIAKSA